MKYIIRRIIRKITHLIRYELNSDSQLLDFLKFFGILKIDKVGNECIILDKILDRDILLWYFFLSDVGQSLFYRGDFEENEIRLIKRQVKPGNTILDIGANIGYHSIIMSKLVGNSGKIYAIEPFDLNVELIKINAYVNHANNIEICQLAMADINGLLKFKIYEDYAFNSFLKINRKKYLKEIEVETETIDYFVKRNNLNKIDFIKIDVEGFELRVLKGGVETLKNHHPQLICEIDQRNLGSRRKVIETINFIKALGYEGFTITKKSFRPIELSKDINEYNYYFRAR